MTTSRSRSSRSNVVTEEARTRTMLADVTTWPGLQLRLCMKRDNPLSFGIVYDTVLPIEIYPYNDGIGQNGADDNGTHWLYATIDELIADGWLVD